MKDLFERNEQGNIIGDGITEAERIIKDAGIEIKEGVIYLPKHLQTTESFLASGKLGDAILHLCHEWDYFVEFKQ